MLICVCNEAKENCDKSYPKGRLYEPEKIIRANWPMYYSMEQIRALKKKTLREMRSMNS